MGCRHGGAMPLWSFDKKKSNKGIVCWHSARPLFTSYTGFAWKRSMAAAGQWPKTLGRVHTPQRLRDKKRARVGVAISQIFVRSRFISQRRHWATNDAAVLPDKQSRMFEGMKRERTRMWDTMTYNFLHLRQKYVSLNQPPALTEKEAKLTAEYSQSVVQTFFLLLLLLFFFFFIMTVLLVFYFVAI